MSLKVYDNLTREKRAFEPVSADRVGMYVCGMTVQDRPHVGHMRAAIVGDLLRRYLQRIGHKVTYLNNFTDIDDKIIERAKEEGADYTTIARRNMDAYLDHVEKLGILPADLYPRATEHIPEILDMIAMLEQKGFAYAAGGDVYFRVERCADYGKLSGRRVDELRAGARIEIGEHKESALDFTLWKGAREGEPSWPTRWGPGRPGWHIECSAMATKYLGNHFDFHGGGLDLIFPHHENEIAQSECATGEPFVNYWVQNGLVLLGGEKMSKSTKHFFLIEDVCARVEPRIVRFYLLSTHFRSPIEFSEERLAEAGVGLGRLTGALDAASEALGKMPERPEQPVTKEDAGTPEARETIRAFHDAMEDDFNSAKAIGHLFDLARCVNRWTGERETGETRAAVEGATRVILDLAGVLGLDLLTRQELCIPSSVEDLARRRTEARGRKDWKEADRLRDAILAEGYVLEDREGRTIVRPNR
jgi:cysteinyl-tRNA synthetase